MNGATARLSDHLPAQTRGRGLAVCARWRFAVVADLDVVYTDAIGIPALRERFPQWASEPVAPVSVEQDPVALGKVADGSVDFMVAFEFFETPSIETAFAGAARIVAPGGSLILLQDDGKDGEEAGREQVLMRVLSAEVSYRRDFRFAIAAGIGPRETAIVLERRWPGLGEGELVSHAQAVYVVEAGRLRHVQSPAVLTIIQQPGQLITPIATGHFQELPIGKGVSETAALGLLEARAGREQAI